LLKKLVTTQAQERILNVLKAQHNLAHGNAVGLSKAESIFVLKARHNRNLVLCFLHKYCVFWSPWALPKAKLCCAFSTLPDLSSYKTLRLTTSVQRRRYRNVGQASSPSAEDWPFMGKQAGSLSHVQKNQKFKGLQSRFFHPHQNEREKLYKTLLMNSL